MRKSVFIKKKGEYTRVNSDEVRYIKSDGDYSTIHLEGGRSILTSRTPLKDLITLFDNPTFFRVHKSYIVNIEKINRINADGVFIDNQLIPVSTTKKKMLTERLKI